MIDLRVPAEYGYQIRDFRISRVSDYRIEGYSHQLSRNVWSGGINQDYIVHFVIEFNRPIIHSAGWLNGEVLADSQLTAYRAENERTEESREGKECGSGGRHRWPP